MLFVALFLLLACVDARIASPSFVKSAFQAQRRMANVQKLAKRGVDPTRYLFDQRVNHFGRNHGKTFKQQYWIDTSYFNPSVPSPMFVQLGEEAPASGDMASDMAMASYGLTRGALLVAIEHRFYGQSQPTGDFADLGYLSVDQALADYAAIIEYLKGQYNITNVVVFGCSYIGAGAAWFRAKYPHLITGAVASSAPVLAVVDFFKYLDQVDLSILEQYGSECVSNIQTAMISVNSMLLNNNNSLVGLFQLCQFPKSKLDKQNFVSDLMSTVMTIVQYDYEVGNIPQMCATIGNGTDPLLGLGTFYTQQSSGCTDVLYTDMIAQLQNVTYDPSQNMRQWTYQTCTEFGYFQTTDNQNQPFALGNWVPVSFYERICNDAFQGVFNVTQSVADTNIRFGGNALPHFWARNVVFDNSVVDPWHTLSVQQDVNEDSPLYMFDTVGHCGVVSYPSPNDPPSVKQVRQQIALNIDKWIVEENK